MVNLDELPRDREPYLGWYLETAPQLSGTYTCYAWEDRGDNTFRVSVDVKAVVSDPRQRFEESREWSLRVAKGKVFLGTWENQQDYKVKLPLVPARLPAQEIRNKILRGLFRLYEDDFAEDSFQVDLEGIAAELRVTRSAVERALDWVYDAGLIKDHGTLGQHRGTGHFWLSSAGAAYVEETLQSPPDSAGAAPMTSQLDTSYATDRKRVAVVHGRDSGPTAAMFDLLFALRLDPIEWTQAIAATGKATPYNKEAVAELFRDTQAVVVLMTGDDEAQLREQFRRADDDPFESQLTPQPRPNVLIELGMAFGIMDTRTIIVQVGKLRPMSDLAGLNVIRLSNDPVSRKGLVARLKAAGCDLDDSGDHWLTAGDFAPTPPKRSGRRAKPSAGPKAQVLEVEAPRSEERDRPVFEVIQSGGTRLETGFAPHFEVRQVSGDYVPNVEWRIRGPRFSMEWRPASGSALARTSFLETFDLAAQPHEDNLVDLDEIAFELRFRWRGQWRHELHRWPISRRELPSKILWDIGQERIPPSYFDRTD